MQNQFDTDNFPDGEPSELVSGARWGWTRSDITAAYPTVEYTLTYRFSLQSGNFGSRNITAAKTGSVHIVDQAQADTAGLIAGAYQWQAYVVRDSDNEEVVVDSGLVTIVAEFKAGVDTRSHVAKVLDAIQATLLGTASKEQEEYTIAGRTIINRPITELMAMEKEYKKRLKSEMDAIERKAGRSTNNRVLVKMSA